MTTAFLVSRCPAVCPAKTRTDMLGNRGNSKSGSKRSALPDSNANVVAKSWHVKSRPVAMTMTQSWRAIPLGMPLIFSSVSTSQSDDRWRTSSWWPRNCKQKNEPPRGSIAKVREEKERLTFVVDNWFITYQLVNIQRPHHVCWTAINDWVPALLGGCNHPDVQGENDPWHCSIRIHHSTNSEEYHRQRPSDGGISRGQAYSPSTAAKKTGPRKWKMEASDYYPNMRKREAADSCCKNFKTHIITGIWVSLQLINWMKATQMAKIRIK